ncbi:uncharacterized protein PADG_11978 [Paracoccidioides brasiliensis Pb18]|uniref:Uncharacterized protein n=2 Tax=Paracoccidioides brasiliensis TaxID=121759 RepID=A0A0A0HUZ0_PARBD|nr:uncharacterized protein PADG_11978 [Paracoccidioides brasiliensis Pb18]KGM91841.1 hypothetical protein PADG_11978 [Paracoccidioides brasiliensis Pb18]ODH25765.1 hypothetical protein ACO22_05068 [Paracoccidioides brasiliensis]ODH52868.1 hypothetical protein GX48_01062 [Paracoccidioides brasiliensis]
MLQLLRIEHGIRLRKAVIAHVNGPVGSCGERATTPTPAGSTISMLAVKIDTLQLIPLFQGGMPIIFEQAEELAIRIPVHQGHSAAIVE